MVANDPSSRNLFSQTTGQTIPGNKKVPVIELSGDGYQRGLQHGKALKKEIAEVFEKWKKNIQRSMKQNADSVITQFYNATDFVPAIKKWTPGIYEELAGLSEGSGRSFKDVFCFQLVNIYAWRGLSSVYVNAATVAELPRRFQYARQ